MKIDYTTWIKILVILGVLASMTFTYLSIKWHEHIFHKNIK